MTLCSSLFLKLLSYCRKAALRNSDSPFRVKGYDAKAKTTRRTSADGDDPKHQHHRRVGVERQDRSRGSVVGLDARPKVRSDSMPTTRRQIFPGGRNAGMKSRRSTARHYFDTRSTFQASQQHARNTTNLRRQNREHRRRSPTQSASTPRRRHLYKHRKGHHPARPALSPRTLQRATSA